MKTFTVLLAVLLFLTRTTLTYADTTPFAQHEKLALHTVTANRTEVPCYEKLELTLDLKADYENPFDPEQISVVCYITAPGGRSIEVNGFLNQNVKREVTGDGEKWTPEGKPFWSVRFTPDVPGKWAYAVAVHDKSGFAYGPVTRFTVTPSKHPGFLRGSEANPGYFAYDNGTPFFAVGENMGWGGKRGTGDYDEWLAALGKAGGNWIRVWMSSWNGALEWSKEAKGDWRNGTYYGVGVYALDNAAKVDYILDTAEKNGIATMLCFGTYGEFKDGGFFNEGQWKANPYNKANGGPCEKPEDFWTNETARKLYRRRLRYIAARYGYRTSLHAWEFWNEANPPADWVQEMARYLKGQYRPAERAADPYHHLVSTSYGSDAIWKLPEIDFTMTHDYGTGDRPDFGPIIRNDAANHTKYGKPHLMAEFGIDWRDADTKYDPDGKAVNFHNGMWAGVAGGDAGTGMLWWWDNYVAPKNLYAQFTPVRKFTDKVNWNKGTWKPAALDPAATVRATETLSDLTLSANGGWGKSAQSDFTLTPLGVAGNTTLPTFLYSPGKADLRTTPRFHVNRTKPGRFVMTLNTVSNFVTLRVLLDDKPAATFHLDAKPPANANVKPEYASTKYMDDYKIYQAQFNKDYGIDVPAGAHTIALEVTDGDWASISAYTLTNYRSSRYAEVNLYGMTNGEEAVIWAQNARHAWKNVFDKRAIPTVAETATVLHGLKPGRYTVEIWNTWQGTLLKTETATCTNDRLPLNLPPLERDVALHIVRQ